MRAALSREAFAWLRSQPVASLSSAVLVAAMVGIILLTIGRTEGTSAAVRETFESAGSRSVVVRAQAGAGVTTETLDRLRTIDDVGEATGFGPSVDVHNAGIDGGTLVSRRALYTDEKSGRGAFAGRATVTSLGFVDGIGVIAGPQVRESVYSRNIPEPWRVLGDVVLRPVAPAPGQTVSVIVVSVGRTSSVGAARRLISSMIDADDPSKVSIKAGSDLGDVSDEVTASISGFGRSLVLLLSMGVGLLLTLMQSIAVLSKRRDFGRRRALGASRSTIVSLVLLHTLMTTVVGLFAGSAISGLILAISGNPLPPARTVAAVTVVAAALGLAASLVPAYLASTRDPLRELRTA